MNIRDILEKEVGYKTWWNGDKRGDYSANVGSAEKAKEIKEKLSDSKYLSKIETVNGFVNFWLSENALEEGIKLALQDPSTKLGASKIQVEFISANPTGPLTLGNGRGGVYGDVLANILKFVGNDVTKEYYINDAGNQIEVLMENVREGEGVYLDSIKKIFPNYVLENADNLLIAGPEGTKKVIKDILENIKKTIGEMGINFDVWFSERKELREKGKFEEIIDWLKKEDLIYEKEEATWFKASKFGDDEDRVLIKKDGQPTYFGVDCAYHKNKFVERKFDKVINIWGADHHGDVARVKGFVEALGYKDKLEIILMQFVRLVKDGKSVRMSKRGGDFVLVDDVLKEINKDVFRYFMLQHSANSHMDFDLNLAKEQSKKNPVYYIQYAGARMSSILKKSKSDCSPTLEFSVLDSKLARNLILKLIQFPEVVLDISKDYQVHHLTTYIYELAKTFTNFYENVRVLDEENKETKEQLLNLVFMTRQVLEKALGLLDVSVPEKM